MPNSRRQNHTSGPPSPDTPDPPDPLPSPSLLGLIWGAIQKTGTTVRLGFILLVLFGGVELIMQASKGVYMPWPGFVMPVLRFPVTALGASALTLVVAKVNKVVKSWLKERKERKKQKELQAQQELRKQQELQRRKNLQRQKNPQRQRARMPNGQVQARTRSSAPSPRQDPKRPRPRRLPSTRLRPGLYRPRLG